MVVTTSVAEFWCRIGCAIGGKLPKWRPQTVVTTSVADFWCRIRCIPGREAFGQFAFTLFYFGRSRRPDIAGCSDLWAARHK